MLRSAQFPRLPIALDAGVNRDVAIIQGSSRLVLGRQKPSDGQESADGVEIDVEAGDVVVVPAGVSHRSLDGTSEGGYRYIGVYPEVSHFFFVTVDC
jgi:uncharacterized protein YjlB